MTNPSPHFLPNMKIAETNDESSSVEETKPKTYWEQLQEDLRKDAKRK